MSFTRQNILYLCIAPLDKVRICVGKKVKLNKNLFLGNSATRDLEPCS